MTELLSVRDILTDRLLRPTVAAWHVRLFGSDPTLAPLRRVPSVTGIGVLGGDDEELELAIFYDRAGGSGESAVPSGIEHLMSRLRSERIPLSTHAGVSFEAASRPAEGGESLGLGRTGGASGTLGCRVQERGTALMLGLSCNHVIADLNAAPLGTHVWQPAAGRGGTAASRIGLLHAFASIDFTSGAYNVLDAALVKPDNPADLASSVLGIGTPSGINTALAFGDPVKKVGAAGGRGDGKYRFRINCLVSYGARKALFRDLLGIVSTTSVAFAVRGDSGAVLLDSADAVAGLVISVAAGMNLALATEIKPVLDHFSIDVA